MILQLFKKTVFDFFNKSKSHENQAINNTRFVILDTETTGFNYEEDRILCIGAIALQNNRIEINSGFEVYIQQEYYNKDSAKIHGILKQATYKGSTELEALQQFLDFVDDAILVAHHAVFDITMINKALERNGLEVLKNKSLDTAILYKKTLLKTRLLDRKDRYSLDDLIEKFDISKKDRHTAMGDAYITAIAFLKIINKLKTKKEITLYDLFRIR
jgi:DNA polymerase III subunit epsilon